MRLKNLILILTALATVFVLAACGSSGQPAGDQGNAQEQASQETPEKQAPKQSSQESGGGVAAVYIAGHRLGYENTNSHLAFWDLNEVKEGDEFYITDSEGRQYTYEVFNKFVAGPENLAVLNPVDGKNIVTLQTCTLPDYVNRLLVRGELKEIKEA
jgi:LPXTG-site transpeptidase (sortase) family protein